MTLVVFLFRSLVSRPDDKSHSRQLLKLVGLMGAVPHYNRPYVCEADLELERLSLLLTTAAGNPVAPQNFDTANPRQIKQGGATYKHKRRVRTADEHGNSDVLDLDPHLQQPVLLSGRPAKAAKLSHHGT